MPKKLVIINQFNNSFFDQIPFFAISKMTKNQFLKWGKKFKTARNAISQVFLPGLFNIFMFFVKASRTILGFF
jgi:hypothetical protein